jgi:hypothetical protein
MVNLSSDLGYGDSGIREGFDGEAVVVFETASGLVNKGMGLGVAFVQSVGTVRDLLTRLCSAGVFFKLAP